MNSHAKNCTYGKPEADATFPCDCDGYHTFNDLYDHRITLFIALCRLMVKATNPYLTEEYKKQLNIQPVWRSKRHSDGELCFGTGNQFVLGIGTEEGKQITYHIPRERWSETDFADTLEKAPEFDHHTSEDVIERLKNL